MKIMKQQFIVNKKIDDDEILKFHNSGFVKLNINLKNEVEEYKNKFFIKEEDKQGQKIPSDLSKFSDTSRRVSFSLNDQDQLKIQFLH